MEYGRPGKMRVLQLYLGVIIMAKLDKKENFPANLPAARPQYIEINAKNCKCVVKDSPLVILGKTCTLPHCMTTI